jgi:hypothetical protein
MSLCQFCGNQITVDNCQPDPEHWMPVCLVCQHTGRHEQTATEKLMIANLEEEVEMTFRESQAMISMRINNQTHNRIRPNWDEIDAEERERQRVCQSCNGTGVYLARRCPDCYEDERD